MGTFFSKRRNFLFSQVVGIEKTPKLNTKLKKSSLISRHWEVPFFKPKRNFLSIHFYRAAKNQVWAKVFKKTMKNIYPSTKCQKSGKICIVLEKFLLLINWELFRPKGKIVFQPYTNQLWDKLKNYQDIFEVSFFTPSHNVKNQPFCAYVCGIF